ncbi:hypothetical protein HGB24_02040, partial [Candidatus Saccharibacteria bacterium]|nr:hypothetical protein [Candidatus Saccharibacteria bacterium]
MTVRLWREGKQTITVEESIPFETDQIEDADQNLGYLLVNTPGQNGSKSVTYEVVIQDGREVCRQAIASLVLAQPIKQLQTIGVKGKYNTPTENENITWDFLIQQGFSRLQTAGIMGNLMQEHRFNTSDSAGGYGIVQWTGSRRTALMALPYPDNIYTQLNFLMSELNGGYAGVRDAIKASTTLEDATIIFQNRFERCGICRQDLRLQYASDILASH